jgi:hypothetical protein
MFVHCFTITIKTGSPTSIKSIYQDFGLNIPKYLQYEGGSGGCTFLFCVDISVNIIEICNKYICELGSLYKLEIDDNTYNNSYTICPTYSKDIAYKLYN